jgi:hypothetical protein
MLKKTVAILLLTLFLFNWVGYRLLTALMENTADRQLQARLDDNDYNDDQLISLKVPITNLSYYLNNAEFESIKGKIEIGGIQYKYVKRRIYNDSLEVLCIPNVTAMQLQSAKNSFFAFINGLSAKKQNAHSETYKVFAPEYDPAQDLSIHIINDWSDLTITYADDPASLSPRYAKLPERPPQNV